MLGVSLNVTNQQSIDVWASLGFTAQTSTLLDMNEDGKFLFLIREVTKDM